MVSEKGYALDMDVVAKTGAFTKSVPYNDVVEMQFVKKALEEGSCLHDVSADAISRV